MSEPNTHPARASDVGYCIRPRANIFSTNARQRDDEEFPDQHFDHRLRCYQTAWAVVGLLVGLGSKPPRQWLVERFGKRRAAQILARVDAYFEWVRLQDED